MADQVVSREHDILARHETYATLTSVHTQPCRFMTSLCPNQCGHEAKVAVFTIDKYLHHEKPGQYGEEKQTIHHVTLSGGKAHGGDVLSDEHRAVVEALQVGDKVILNWDHDYVTTTWVGGGSGKGPERPLRKIVKLTPEEAAAAGLTPYVAPAEGAGGGEGGVGAGAGMMNMRAMRMG